MFKLCIGRPKRPPKRPSTRQDTNTSTSISAINTSSSGGVPISISSTSSSSSTNTNAAVRQLLPDGAIIYRYSELSRATNNFSDTNKLGSSTFKAVKVRGKADIAVVRKKGTFVSNYIDLIKVMSSVHHISVVKFLGACVREGEFVHLCYEYEPSVNLREAIAGNAAGFVLLSKWTSRLQVALDVALGLEYLHDHTTPTFLHKHIKNTNILVTNELRGKITKFGVPQLLGEVPTSDNKSTEQSDSLKITGTRGYMAPEYLATGHISTKLDVFSYGVVLLELLSGKHPGALYDARTKSYKIVSLADDIEKVFKDGTQAEKQLRLWMDPKLRDSYPLKTAVSVAILARQCVQRDPGKRPPMKNVAAKLFKYLEESQEWERSNEAFRDIQSQTMEPR